MNENKVNEIIMENLDMEEVMELVPEKRSVNFGKIGLAVLATGAAVALGYKLVKLIKAKRAQKAQADDFNTVEDADFEDEDIAE